MILGSDAWKKVLWAGSVQMDLPVNHSKVDLLALHAVELMKFNKKMNLTAIKDPMKVLVDHYLDSIVGVNFFPRQGRLLDIGSGGGFPGIPLKIMNPSLDALFIDDSRKKVSFLKHAIRTLGLESAQAYHIRAQTLVQEAGFESSFDVIVSRALSSLADFFHMAIPLVKPDGQMIAWKGKNLSGEIDSLRPLLKAYSLSLGSELSVRIEHYILPYTNVKRSLVLIGRRII